MIPFAQFGWDRAALDPQFSDTITNVLPTASGYGPFPSLTEISEALAAECRGAIMARNLDSSYVIFAATSTKIYKLDAGEWDEVTRASGGDYTLPSGDYWSTVQFGDNVIFCQVNDDPQIFNLSTSTEFAPLTGTPPRSRFVGVQGDYVLLASQAATPNRLWRSGVNDPNFWTARDNGSDFQDLPDGGWITGMVGFDRGAIIFSQTAIRVFEDLPGSALLFSLTKSEPNRGVLAPRSIAQIGNQVFFLSEDGFYRYGAPDSAPIGFERVDKKFLQEHVDPDKLEEVQAAVDPVNKLVLWLYTNSSNERRILGYHYVIDRWFHAETEATYVITAATPGYTLEQLTSILGYTSIEDIPFSLDSRVLKSGQPGIAGFNGDNKLAFFAGSTMEATLETADLPLGGEGRRSLVSGFRPFGDAPEVYGQVGHKDTFGGTRTWTTEQGMDLTGKIPARSSGRTHRFRVRIPEGTDWTHIAGVEAIASPQGAR